MGPIAEVGTAFVTLIPSAKGFGAATAQQVGGEMGSSGKSIGSKFGTAMKYGALAVVGGAAIGAVAFTKSAIALEAAFGKTMNVLQATVNAPKSEMRELSDLAMKMGADTVFSANDAATAMLELARGGMTAATIQGGALQGTLTLAAAGELEMGEAANIAVRAMGAFGLEGKQMRGVAAALAGAANASSSSVRDLSFSLAQGGLAANSVGFSIQETTGILAAFSNAGLEGSDAGTSMKTFLDRLVPSTDKADKALRALNITAKDGSNAFLKANGEYRSATQIAEALKRGTEDLNASERKRLITQAFGSDAQRAATILAQEGAKGLQPLIKATSDKSAADRMAQANMKGTAGAIERMKGSVETASLAWGQAIKPVTMFGANLVAEIANGAVPIIQDFGREMRVMLKGADFSVIQNALDSIDIGATFQRIGSALRGINWAEARQGLSDFGAAVKDSEQPLGPFSDLISVTGTILRFAADHVDLLAKALPYLAAGFVAIKVAQAAANAAAAISVPLRIAEVVATRQQTKALAAHRVAMGAALPAMAAETGATVANTAAQSANNAATATGTSLTIRQRVAAMASAVAQRAIAAATTVWTGAQWLLNAALTANPIGLVVAAVAALVAGLVIAYKKSETFRNVVTGAFDAVAAAGRWLWNNALQPAFHFIVSGIAWVIRMFGNLLEALSNVPGFGWAEGAANAMQGAADKADALADNITKIPENKTVNLNVNEHWVTTRTVRRGGMGPQLMATGGIVTRPTLAIVGEGRESEAVMPLSKLSTMLDRERATSGTSGGGRMSLTITNWDEGTGYIENVADGRIIGANQLAGETARAM